MPIKKIIARLHQLTENCVFRDLKSEVIHALLVNGIGDRQPSEFFRWHLI